MEGSGYFYAQAADAELRGVIPRAIEQIFEYIDQRTINHQISHQFLIRVSYLQIYNETISDLLQTDRQNLIIREDKQKGVYIEGLSEWVVKTPQEMYELMERGATARATGDTFMNEASSRSHAVLIIYIEQWITTYVDENEREIDHDSYMQLVNSSTSPSDRNRLDGYIRNSFKTSKLNLVDLAGSERVSLSGASGIRLEESKLINKSLAALGNVISALADPKHGRQHIPYRDSKLTRVLEDSLGGNCKTTVIATISPSLDNLGESLSTLKFANRAKNIRNEAVVNEDIDPRTILYRYEQELQRLRNELAMNKSIDHNQDVSQQLLKEADDRVRRVEQEKQVLILTSSREKQQLEGRIAMLTRQVRSNESYDKYISISTDADTEPYGAADIARRLHDEFDRQSDSVMNEGVEEGSIDEQNLDRYKRLLLKQREIMIALTQRLVERDEQIVRLKEQLNGKSKHIISGSSCTHQNRDTSAVSLDDAQAAIKMVTQACEDQSLNPVMKVNQIMQLLLPYAATRDDSDESSKEGITTLTQHINLEQKVNYNNDSSTRIPTASEVADTIRLQSILDELKQEREAITVILERKVAVLVESIRVNADSIQTSNTNNRDGSAVAKLVQDSATLRKMVQSTVIALHNSTHM